MNFENLKIMRHFLPALAGAFLLGCDADRSALSSPDTNTPDTASEAVRLTLESSLNDLTPRLFLPLREIRQRIDLRTNTDFSNLEITDRTLLQDYISKNVDPRNCSLLDTTNGKRLACSDNLTFWRYATYYASSMLDSALDSTVDLMNRLSLARQLDGSLWKSSSRTRSTYLQMGGSGQDISMLRISFGNHLKYQIESSSYLYGWVRSDTLIFQKTLTPATYLWVRGVNDATGGLLGRVPAFKNLDLGSSSGRFEWTSDSGLSTDPDLKGRADTHWYLSTGALIYGDLDFRNGKSIILRLGAKKISGFDTIWVENGAWKMVNGVDTTALWLHDNDLRLASPDSLEIREFSLGRRWTNTWMHISWQTPPSSPADSKVRKIQLRGTLADGRLESIQAKLMYSNGAPVWSDFVRTVSGP